MKKLSGRSQRWLKSVHLLCAAVWTSSAIALIAMQVGLHADGGGELYGILRAAKFIDDFLIIPGAVGSLLTGLIYSIWTKWGFFRHRWITVKWVINVGGILFGTFFLGVWLNSLPPLAARLGLDALSDPIFIRNRMLNLVFGGIQTFSLVFALVISVIKPWSRR
jgi:hypothetical protein